MNIAISRPLRNHWFALRHGQSEANVAQIVVSDPANGCDGYGLTAHGRQQFQQSLAATAMAQFGTTAPDKHALLITSDFARAAQSAAIAAQLLQTNNDVQTSIKLRERYFGQYELRSADAYESVWRADRDSTTQAAKGVEPVMAVALRMAALVASLEQQHNAQTIVLVSHGDPLQILECVFRDQPLRQHRELAPLQNAELRLLGTAQSG